jgi:uncharacterized membrane protein YfcA
MAWYTIPALIAAGFAAGFINTLAGSGSLITLPALIWIGLPATVANGTNRIAILMQNVVGVGSFMRHKILDVRGTLLLGIPATVGSVIGAQIAVNLDEVMMRRVIGAIMVAMLLVILVRPQRWLQGRQTELNGRPTWVQLLIFFAIGMYGGFIQAGVGIFLLAGLVLAVGYDLVRANAVKLGIVLFYIPFALAVFIRNHQVDLLAGLILGVGNMLGAWVGARTAVERGAVWVRRLLIAVVLVSAVDLLGIGEVLTGLIK